MKSAIAALSAQVPDRRNGDHINVLDHGRVALLNWMGDERAIVEAARVLPWAQPRGEADDKLLRYMLENKHTSPFEQVVFKFYVKAPIFVFRQWHRHRTWSYNEVSARYKELPEEFYVPDPGLIGTQSTTNHQSRNEGDVHPDAAVFAFWIREACEDAFRTYRSLLEKGCPRELARGVLPVNTYSEMITTVDLHNLLHFLRLRLDEHAQYEIRVYAEAMRDLIRPIVPKTIALLEEIL